MATAARYVSKVFAEKMTEKFSAAGRGEPRSVGYGVIAGRRYDKIVVLTEDGQPRSVHAFVDRETGLLYKAEGWAKPAKGARYDISTIQKIDQVVALADWAGGYLYAR